MFAKQWAAAAVLLLVCAASAKAQECFAMETDLKVCIRNVAGYISLLVSGWCSSAIIYFHRSRGSVNRPRTFLQQSPSWLLPCDWYHDRSATFLRACLQATAAAEWVSMRAVATLQHVQFCSKLKRTASNCREVRVFSLAHTF